MIVETISAVKHGVCIRQWPSADYSIVYMNGLAMIQDKHTRSITTILSPNYYDYIEIEREEVDHV